LAQEVSQGNRAIHYIPELDGLRGIAIILVVLFHTRLWPEAYEAAPSLYTILGLGSTGVDLFFVLSGFLITSILLSTRDASPRSYFWSFYARRTLRIFPLYFLAVGVFFFIQLPYLQNHGDFLQVSRSEQIWYWTYMVNWHDAAGHIISGMAHFWSLSVEEQFYLVWPAVVFFCEVRYFPAMCIGVGAFSVILRIILGTGHFMPPVLLPEFVHRTTITRLDTLAVGALVAALVRNPDWTNVMRRQINLIAPAAFGAFLLLWLAREQNISFVGNPGIALDFLGAAIAYGCVVFICVTEKGSSKLLCRIARWRPLQSIGRYSYAMYLVHVAVGRFLFERMRFIILPHLGPVHGVQRVPSIAIALLFSAITVGSTYLVAFASWHLFEQRFLRLKKYFPYLVSLPVSSELKTEDSAV